MAFVRTITLEKPSTLVPWALLLTALMAAPLAFGQKRLVDSRDQAQGWFLPVHLRVMQQGERCNDYQVTVYKDNSPMAAVTVDKKGRATLELDIDGQYSVLVSKPGFTSKLIYLDTTLPKDLVTYPDYEMTLNLVPESILPDPFYADFPTGIVRWDADMEGFYHSEPYMAHIQSKLGGGNLAGVK